MPQEKCNICTQIPIVRGCLRGAVVQLQGHLRALTGVNNESKTFTFGGVKLVFNLKLP